MPGQYSPKCIPLQVFIVICSDSIHSFDWLMRCSYVFCIFVRFITFAFIQDLKSSTTHMSPLSVRASSRTQDSSFIQDPDESVVKISSMFPTVSETHIRLLLKKYMKSIFPKAEETVILDVLANNENNIQKTSECLKGMGFVKKDPAKLKQELEDKAKEREEQQQIAKADSPPPMPKIKTQQEKDSVKLNLLDSYSDIPEHVIGMALDSVHFDEDRAKQILDIMVQEDNKIKENNRKDQVEDEVIEVTFLTVVNNVASSQSRQSLKSLLKEKQDNSKTIYNRVIEENSMNNSEYKSSNLSSTNGCNPDFANGANQKLLLEDYVNWQGPNPKLSNGPNRSLLLPRREAYKASGANPDLCKGPVFGLAKGSIFSQLKSMAIGESRGK
ncbi:PREDICTED: uncharacterized protein LOC108565477 isoform X3 [Nicrophorus vespilloides]|uniref:Uncharacterized protein LOC108565477 isoform X3 n=1 Tax=Nicrophorus vespilloides TaxID=110193 RepID=A0ABM1N0W9_NICVS|nr:PREDICTED: uncharacterized protein LOC108565477 isoform X3 [Nicrophorus vespilloides]